MHWVLIYIFISFTNRTAEKRSTVTVRRGDLDLQISAERDVINNNNNKKKNKFNLHLLQVQIDDDIQYKMDSFKRQVIVIL